MNARFNEARFAQQALGLQLIEQPIQRLDFLFRFLQLAQQLAAQLAAAVFSEGQSLKGTSPQRQRRPLAQRGARGLIGRCGAFTGGHEGDTHGFADLVLDFNGHIRVFAQELAGVVFALADLFTGVGIPSA